MGFLSFLVQFMSIFSNFLIYILLNPLFFMFCLQSFLVIHHFFTFSILFDKFWSKNGQKKKKKRYVLESCRKSYSYLFFTFQLRAKAIKEWLHSVKNNSNFEFAALFHHLNGEGKSAPISKLELFLTEWSWSYFVFALQIYLVSSK